MQQLTTTNQLPAVFASVFNVLPKCNVRSARAGEIGLIPARRGLRLSIERNSGERRRLMTTTCALRQPPSSRLQDLVHSIEYAALAEAPADLWQYARKETFQQEFGRERRRDRRYSLITNVVVAPVDGKCRQAGEPFVALSSGMSVSGIRLIHTCPAPAELLFLEIGRDAVKYLLSVLRSMPVGPCFEIAGQLVKVDAEEPSRPPIRVTTVAEPVICVAERGGIRSPLAPTADELAQWAAVSAAIETLKAAR